MVTKEKLINNVREVIQEYNMLDMTCPVPVAFSGGKDSASTIFILNELGYDVRPVIVDRGDDILFNSLEIANILKEYGYVVDILYLRDEAYLESIYSFAADDIKKYIDKFDNLKEGESPCTFCYNARTTALSEYADNLNSPAFVIGQHKTDMVTSLMKCYWTEQYYNLLTLPLNVSYDGYRMQELIAENEIDIDYLEMMVAEGRATTDDPPVEVIRSGIKLVRPLSAISEIDIKEYISDYPYDSDNCTYRQKEPRPFRLLVQLDLEKRIKKNCELENILYEYVLRNINDNGTLKFRPRNKREDYYPGFKPYIQKI